MGDWRRVFIQGDCPAAEVSALRDALTYGGNGWEGLHPLVCIPTMLGGLDNWAEEAINAVGGLAERGFDAEDVAKAVRVHLLPAAPGLKIRIHISHVLPDDSCEATVLVANGEAEVVSPMMDQIPDISGSHMEGRFLRAMLLKQYTVGGK